MDVIFLFIAFILLRATVLKILREHRSKASKESTSWLIIATRSGIKTVISFRVLKINKKAATAKERVRSTGRGGGEWKSIRGDGIHQLRRSKRTFLRVSCSNDGTMDRRRVSTVYVTPASRICVKVQGIAGEDHRAKFEFWHARAMRVKHRQEIRQSIRNFSASGRYIDPYDAPRGQYLLTSDSLGPSDGNRSAQIEIRVTMNLPWRPREARARGGGRGGGPGEGRRGWRGIRAL